MPPSHVFSEIRRVRRNRHGSTRYDFKRTKAAAPALKNQTNVPRQRQNTLRIGRTDAAHVNSSVDDDYDESLTSSLIASSYLETKSSVIPSSVKRDLKSQLLKPYKPRHSARREDDYDEDDEEFGCLEGKDPVSKQRRQFLRMLLRDCYVLFFILMFLAAISVVVSNRKDSSKQGQIVLRAREHTGGNRTVQTIHEVMDILEPLKNLTSPYQHKQNETPLFLDIALTGADIIKSSFFKCHNHVVACEQGLRDPNFSEDTLNTFTASLKHYNATLINVDTSTETGIERAAKLKLAESRLADVVTMKSLYYSAKLFDTSHSGRAFAMFSYPISRAIAYYHYMKTATWDKRHDSEMKKMTLAQFAASKHLENNPMVRLLTDSPNVDPDRDLTEVDFEVAKKVVETKFIVGLYRDLPGSMARFDRYFGWSSDVVKHGILEKEQARDKRLSSMRKCRSELAHGGDRFVNMQTDRVDMDSVEYRFLEGSNRWDIKLYNYLEYLYGIQGEKIFGVV